MSCQEVRAWPRKQLARLSSDAALSAANSSSSSVLLRTSGLMSTAMSPCSRGYLTLLQRELRGLADMHLLTDLSMTAPDHLTPRALRALSNAHERELERELPGVEAMAFTTVDLMDEWPGVVWPVPGDSDFRAASEFDTPTQGWLSYVYGVVKSRGNATRTLPARRQQPARRASNLVSYFVHEPSLCLWARRRARRPYVWVLEDDAPFLGSIRVPVAHYSASTVDLVAVFAPHLSVAATWPRYVNARFEAYVRPGVPVHKWEHVERYSVALLGVVGELLRDGVVGFGEVYAGTVCNRTEWCRCADLRATGLVQRDANLFGWSKPVGRKDLRRLFGGTDARARNGRGMNRWLHAVHGACDVLATARCAAGENEGRGCELDDEAGRGMWIEQIRKMGHDVGGKTKRP